MPHRREEPTAPHLPPAPPEAGSAAGPQARILVTATEARLAAMSHLPDRRRHDRIEGGAERASIAVGPVEIAAGIADIGRGGVWLRAALDGFRPGASVRVALPGAADAVAARLVRHTEDGAAFAFHQDPASLAIIDRALAALAARRAA